ncbi:transglycosylase domain-containing protein [Actinomycetospora cinnamomea]|uniref:Membrane peptidoglycan carboxypeptidase n=1 Tax=Actinomycetospora cinnamomea TaxID=663609 RepID=A0A2U1F3Z6_9PSEU|nr:transglycosylase domain-containing protein [Actinomycetospora cinnamomea]PVZ06882.1 membrane peptidoglycan carboxypeptidase [Actinomycetospora cinnamomea]
MGRPDAEDSDHSGAGLLPLLLRALAATAVAGALVAAFLAPIAVGAGTLMTRATTSAGAAGADILDARPAAATVMTDATGEPMALLYRRYRLPVGPEGIADAMKDAIVAIEDRRFYEHDGVDPRGLARAVASNASQGTPLEGQGASTITMQYVKNQRLYVLADTPQERRAATADTLGRKLTEVRLAQRVEDRLGKDAILARYLDLVYFGRGAYGVEAAARTWFGTTADALTVPQAALLAGMVRAPGNYDPIDEPEAARARRDQVLAAMTEVGSLTPAEAEAARAAPLGVVPDPAVPDGGCAAARQGTGFFCQEVVDRLAAAGLDVAAGGYTIRTTLDPRVTARAREAAEDAVDEDSGVAEAVAVVAPESDRRPVLALAANRTHGADAAAGETLLPITTAPLRGAGSVYKIFTAAAALEQGLVTLDSELDVPDSYTSTAFDDAGEDYTVENLGSADDEMTLQRALAESPNTPFVALLDRLGSVDPVVDVARRLGLRATLAAPAPDGRPRSEWVRDAEQASFTLGPDPTSPLDLANVAATITAGGTWCPTTLVTQVTDRAGRDVTPPTPACERAVSPGVASQLREGLSEDHVDGTAEDAADDAGWGRSMIGKTGTTQRSTSAAFVGATDRYAGAVMAFSLDEPAPVCVDPVRTCSDGDLTGGSAPAETWFDLMTPLHRGSGATADDDGDQDED